MTTFLEPMMFAAGDDRRKVCDAVRGLRRARGCQAIEAARRMGLPLRSYYSFESGSRRFSFALIQRFAAAMDADPFALLLAVQTGDPAAAVRLADNRLAAVWLKAATTLSAEAGDAVRTLDAFAVSEALAPVVKGLAAEALRRRAAAVEASN